MQTETNTGGKRMAKRKNPKPETNGMDMHDNRTAMMAAALKKEFGTDFCNVIVDPDAPLKTATDWIAMPAWWTELTDVPGVAAGHLNLIQGRPDCGKTTLAMEAMIQAQKLGWYIVLIDSEFKFNFDRFKMMGGDLTQLIHIEAPSLEVCFDRIEKVMKKITFRDKDARLLIAWDSLGFTPTQQELDGGADGQAPATAARVIKRNLRRLISLIHSQRVAVLVVNHVYSKIGNMVLGDSTKGYGGEGAYYAAVLVIEVKKIGVFRQQREGEKYEYLKVQLKLRKNHLSGNQGTVRVVKVMPMGIEMVGKAKATGADEDDEMVQDDDIPSPKQFGAGDEDEVTAADME